jgi:TolB-like protein/class 3 adenylate cyclase/tetratricopeptide (TPR) repeat protein
MQFRSPLVVAFPMAATPRADRSLPTGTVTFLFTDIEGSTRLWETSHSAMQAAVARHDELMRQSVAARGGHVFKTVGDAFCVAFSTAPQAVLAGLSAQQALHAEPWPEALPIRVRMALHTGTAELRDDDYFGTALNHVARLLAIAHGGQTLLSEITHDLCRDRLPVGSTLKPLGEHGLKDIARREAVFQLCHPGLASSFPPLRTAASPSILDETPSIAVLPFVNMSRDEENEYFADGIAEELLNMLSKIRGVRVASRTSAFSFKGIKIDIPTLAQKLNVATILEGSVRKSGKRVRISAQLIHVATDSHLWSDTYDRDVEDIFAVQDDIARSVVKELRWALLGERPDASSSAAVEVEVQAAAKGRGKNVDAYHFYLQGRYFVDRRTRKGMEKGVKYLRRAIELDQEYALAWAALASAQTIEARSGWTPYGEGQGRAREAAERALLLEPDLAEAHVALGFVRMAHWDWPGADASMQRALALAPGDAAVVLSAAWVVGMLGRLDESIALCRRAIALDPLNLQGRRYLGLFSLFAGFLEQAEAALKEALELNPLGGFTHEHLGQVYLAQGRFAEALATFKKESDKGFRLLGLSAACHALGRKAQSSAALEQLSDIPTQAFKMAEGNAYRGDVDQAFEWLERAYTQRHPGLCQTRLQPLLLNLHGDPRWQPFLKKIGLTDQVERRR